MIPRATGFPSAGRRRKTAGEAVFKALEEAGHDPSIVCPAGVIQTAREAHLSSETDGYRVVPTMETVIKTIFQEEANPEGRLGCRKQPNADPPADLNKRWL